MGFLDYLSPALTTATQAVNAWQAGDQQRQRQEQQQQLEMLKQIRQKRLDDQAQAYQQMQMTEMGTRNTQMLKQMSDADQAKQQTEATNRGLYTQGHTQFKDNPAFSGDYIPGHDYGKEFDTATGGVTTAATKKTDWNADNLKAFNNLKRDYPDAVPQGVVAPDPNVDYDREYTRREGLEKIKAQKEGTGQRQPRYIESKRTDTKGRPMLFNPVDGTYTEAPPDIMAPNSARLDSAQGQSQRGRFLVGVNEGIQASRRMEAFEHKYLKNGQLDLGGLDVLGADIASSPTEHGGALGDLGSIGAKAFKVAAQSYMGSGDKRAEVQQYLRDAQYVARAEQMISARGGTEAMAHATADLARAPANASAATVLASQRMRKSIFGNAGALMQTMTPEQLQKMADGLEKLKQEGGDSFNFSGFSTGGSGGSGGAAAPPPPGGSTLDSDVDAFIRANTPKRP